MSLGRFLRRASRVVLPIAGAVIGSAVGMPQLGAAAGSSLGAALNGGNLRQSLLSGAGTYAGASLGSALGGSLGTVGNAVNNAGQLGNFASLAGSVGAGNIGSQLLGTSVGSILGGYYGNSMADMYSGLGQKAQAQTPQNDNQTSFTPTQEAAQQAPASISGFSSLAGDQQATNLANQGVYGQGNGPDEQSYYLNLLNRRLVDQSGNVQQDAGLQPIEQSYLQRLGINSGGNSSNLLEAISRWRQNQAPQAA